MDGITTWRWDNTELNKFFTIILLLDINFFKIWDERVKDGCVRNIRGPHICGDAIDIKVIKCVYIREIAATWKD